MFPFKKMIVIVVVLSSLTLAITLPRGANQPFAPQVIIAQAAKTCPDIVAAALKTVDQRCSSTGRNSLCYGNVQVQVTPQADAAKFSFAKPGDKTPLKNIQALQLNSLDSDANNWGIALMRIQANLPNTAPGQNVTMLLFGNVQITDSTKTAIYPTNAPADVLKPPAPLPTFTATAGGKPVAPRATPRPTNTPRPTATPRFTPTPLAYKPMQAFYFSSGVGQPACAEAPEDGILIQSPKGGTQKITLNIDEAQVVIGSTVYFQAQAGKEMIISTLEGSAEVTAFGQTAVAVAGSRVRVPIDANLRASGPPSQPEPYDLNTMKPLPASHLPVKVTPVAPVPTLPSGYTLTTWRDNRSPDAASGSSSDFTCIPNPARNSLFTIARDADGNYLWPGLGDSDWTIADSLGVVHQGHTNIEIHQTSPTHADGTGQSWYMSPAPHFCRWTWAFQLDLVGGGSAAASATEAATP